MSSILDTAEYRKLALIAAGVPLQNIPPIIDTATWRRLLIAALIANTANQAIAGSVDYYSQLPVTVGSPGIGTTYLVKNSSGIYYINYKSAGVYVKLTDTGSLSDWVYAPLSAIGTLPDVTLTNLRSDDFLVWDGAKWVNEASSIISAKYLPTSEFFFSGQAARQIPEFTVNLATGYSYILKLQFIMECNDTGANLFIAVTDIDGQALFDNSSPRFNVSSNNLYINLTAPTGPAKQYDFYGLIEVLPSANATEAVIFTGSVGASYDGAGGQLGSTSYVTFQRCNF